MTGGTFTITNVLVVPVIRNAEKLSFEGIEKEVVRLAVKAREPQRPTRSKRAYNA